MMNDEQIKKTVHSAFDKGLACVEDRPSLRHKIMQNAREEQRTKRKLSMTLVCALILATIATAACAAGIHFGVFDFLANHQGDVLPTAQQMVVRDLAAETLEHTSIVVDEAVYDGGNLRIVYSVAPRNESMTAEEAASIDGVSLNGCDWFLVNGEEQIMTNGSYFDNMLSPEENRMLCYLDIYLASSGIAPEGDFEIALPLIRAGKETKLVAFTVPGYKASKNAVKTQTDSVNAMLLSASVSPVRSYVRLRLEKRPNASSESYESALYDWQDAYLTDAQGDPLAAPIEILMDRSEAGKWMELTYVFQPVNADEAFFAPTVITSGNEHVVDMAHAMLIK